MKYLILITLFIVGCTSTQVTPLSYFECAILDHQNVMVKLFGKFESTEEAHNTTEKVRLSLVQKKLLSEDTNSSCTKVGP